jgi:putative sterol carrier protein
VINPIKFNKLEVEMAGFDNKEAMQVVIEKWLDLISKDTQISERCKGINVSMSFEMTDIDFIFYANFNDGKVSGGLGKSDAMVFLEMSSTVFDGMMTGEVDGASAAMSGDLTFSGDMSAAMGLQALQDDMGRLYKQAKGV